MIVGKCECLTVGFSVSCVREGKKINFCLQGDVAVSNVYLKSKACEVIVYQFESLVMLSREEKMKMMFSM